MLSLKKLQLEFVIVGHKEQLRVLILLEMGLMFVCRSVGRPKHVRVMAGALEGECFVGPKAEVSQ